MTDHVKGELEGKKFGMYADIEKYKDIDEDAILATLTEEELKQLEEELDPEVSFSFLSASDVARFSILVGLS